MTRNSRAGSVAFQPRARLLKLIGEELISDEVVAVMELVKNAHDADASCVTLEFRGVTDLGGLIIVRDDGCGMDLDALLTRWMEPASSSKTDPGCQRTPRGRRVLGQKGVGRFAADKLGARLDLVSRRKGEQDEVVAEFDWDEFDTAGRMLSEIKVEWSLRSPEEITTHGTLLRMSGLRTRWNEKMFRRLSTRLCRLVSPFDGVDDFTIRVESDEFPEYSGELRPDFLERAPYRVDAQFDGGDMIEVSVNGEPAVSHPWNGRGELRCGPVRARLFAFDLETEAVARIGPRIEVRAWLREWSGVSVYRDGFRIWPYGEPHDDWLRLDQRRVNNPVVRLSNNQVVGFVQIASDDNPNLMDQTNREGLIHNRAFSDLRRLVHFVLQVLEAERQAIRHPSGRKPSPPSRNGDERDDVAGALERLARRADPDIASEIKKVAGKVREAFATEEARQRRFVEGYSDLAALGQAAIGLRGTVEPLLQEIAAGCADVRGRINGKGSRALTASLRSVEEVVQAIESRIAMLGAIEGGTSRRRRAIDVPVELESCRSMLQPLLDAAGVRMEIEFPRHRVLRVEMRPEAFGRLMHILALNALDWLHDVEQPRVRVVAADRDSLCELIFSDNGPGIPHELAERVFDPLFSCKEGGRGMGLTIARNILNLHGGSVEVITDGRRRGANLRILLPRKKSRATLHRH